jgi:hypothetical protein
VTTPAWPLAQRWCVCCARHRRPAQDFQWHDYEQIHLVCSYCVSFCDCGADELADRIP